MVLRDSMGFEFYEKDKLCSRIKVYFKENKVSVENYTNDLISQALGKRPNTIDEVYKFFEERCIDKNRPDLKEILESYGLEFYDAEQICRKTHGMLWTDFYWIKFDNQNITYEDIAKLRGWN